MDKQRTEEQKEKRRENYRNGGSEQIYMNEYRKKNNKKLLEDNKKWRLENSQRCIYLRKRNQMETKLLAMARCGGAFCVNCNCGDIRILELNYKQGGHGKLCRQRKLNAGQPLYRHIINGKVDPELFDVRCKICNYAHFVKQKFNIDYSIEVKN